jgi:uncharacterized protein GlcG (DUF336 family)
MHVGFDEARRAIDGACKKAEQIDTRMCIAVVDSGGNLKAFMRMDDAWVGSIDVAIKKASGAHSAMETVGGVNRSYDAPG